MSNLYFNYEIPYFNYAQGVDWDKYKDIIGENTDFIFGKTFDLYKLDEVNYYDSKVVEIKMQALGIDYSITDSLAVKKTKIRTFLSKYRNKGLAKVYEDLAESVTGSVPDIYSGIIVGNYIWSISAWGTITDYDSVVMSWGDALNRFNIYIDVKTIDSALLDIIVVLYQEPPILPAFYKIYLIDSDFKILRGV